MINSFIFELLMTNKNNLLYQIAITQVPGIGDVLAKNLISYCGSVEEVFKQKKHLLLRIPGIGNKVAEAIVNFNDFNKIEGEIEFIERHKITPLFYLDENYPTRLKQYQDAPSMLYYIGNADLNNQKIVAVVGTRKSTEYGKVFLEQLLKDLKETGCMILSGLALGIDIQAHKEALKNDLPTVGVLAHGLDRIYPSSHNQIAKKMTEHGGLLTEFCSNTNPDRENFPKRNRIVAGLCDVLVVVETAERGGAMITAEIANSYNKDVMAVPGRIRDEFSMGCNKLIKLNKAAMISNIHDLNYLMGWEQKKMKKSKQQALPLDLSVDDLNIINFIRQKTKVGIDDIVYHLDLDASILSLNLLDLEFKGLIKQLPGKYFELT
jgi:DNA processing protein